jgi:predicted MFS family arabinose efflux permease
MSEPTTPATTRVLLTAALSLFATSLFMRSVDPLIPQIADSFEMDTRTVALISTAYALPYAISQPLLGGIGDAIGKTLVLKACLVLSVVAGFVGAAAPDYRVLLASRVLVGLVSAGIFPIALAIAADIVPVDRRQVAYGRLLAAAMLGNLLGSPVAGVIADTVGWRGVFALVASLAAVAIVAVQIGFRGLSLDVRTPLDVASVVGRYRAVIRKPLAKVCFSAVMLEGVFLFGLFPFVAVLLAARGEQRAAIAGLVISGFAIGGLLYAGCVSALVRRLGERRLSIGGGALMAGGMGLVALGLAWPFEFVVFMVLGVGFYSLHGVIQVHVTELVPASRGTAMALHGCSFFLGQALGPVIYRYGFDHLGVEGMSAIGAAGLLGVGVLCAATLRSPVKPEGDPEQGV